MQHQDSLEPNRIIVGEHFYSEAISLVLTNAQRELLIFDQDLSHGAFSSIEKYDLLLVFLQNNITSQLRIILQNTDFLNQKCPRLLSLLKTFEHKMSIHLTSPHVKHLKDCFIVADGRHYIKRIHIDQARFKYALDDTSEVEILKSRFSELQEGVQEMVTITPLGL